MLAIIVADQSEGLPCAGPALHPAPAEPLALYL